MNHSWKELKLKTSDDLPSFIVTICINCNILINIKNAQDSNIILTLSKVPPTCEEVIVGRIIED